METLKLGFIVDTYIDQPILDLIATTLLPSNIRFHTVPLGGSGERYTAYITVDKYLQHAYNQILVLFNTESNDLIDIDYETTLYKEYLNFDWIPENTLLVPAVQSVATWLLANYEEHPEDCSDPQRRLAELLQIRSLTEDAVKQLLQTIDIELMRQRSPSFNEFVNSLQKIIPEQRAIQPEPMTQTPVFA